MQPASPHRPARPTPPPRLTQVDIQHRATLLTGCYEELPGGTLFPPHCLHVDSGWQDSTDHPSLTPPHGTPGSVHSDTSN
ncbi:pre-B-cell leukemia transcription factor 3-like [Coregonus clupeaformis]|uniref:pre-B-cell leukemia transcription factor 3-like n=1 Tax=Coregonus clupeaformis TaxID=59861 RepID=UPI001BDFBD10|nr:pre-B-cell leukemia transcription factor 3-like [Coregonus clupeaformis]